ncbi:HAMP domain-containing sensor histidine kinase [Chelatococcus sp. SYSU_G07232]|uniref:histidine kinase n=1 Tax=Chelatococcus albus TaxID=3047466 RepID=A0ABT7AEA1_9HYPH|nr:HAMP domain-containing sensor histidine kinase [Chelatococcus sp. SYSU_G07232]MDJ1157699.1 HAMP domain-containing sensor histidine kinase [Chelatococcus sp. SYSU_G07232]
MKEHVSARVEEEPERAITFGLSARLLVLTVIFVMLAEVLIYVPSVANFRKTWLNDRLAAAQVAALVLEAVPAGGIQPGLEVKLLDGVGAQAVAVKIGGTRRLLAMSDALPEVGRTVDLRDSRWTTLIADAFSTLLRADASPIRILGAGMGGADFVELVMDERPLRAAMLTFSRNILILSLAISAITAGLVYLALHVLIVRSVRRLAANVTAFERDPENVQRIIRPSARRDEIGLAERALARMETTLAGELRQKKHLAALGLAVSKVNHDLRNMLASAQLISDRLSQLDDPTVKRFAPKLIATLGRAIDFCQATLAYGRAAEPVPRRKLVKLAPLVRDLGHLIGLGEDSSIEFAVDVPPDLVVDADPDQLSRVLLNLGRNAVQALTQAGAGGERPQVRVDARRDGQAVVIRIADNGPGVPAKARERLFEAFQGTTRPGGAGLGLAIAAELIRLHGGSIRLEENGAGASFRLVVPDRSAPPAA